MYCPPVLRPPNAAAAQQLTQLCERNEDAAHFACEYRSLLATLPTDD
jgi:hypothetical protein